MGIRHSRRRWPADAISVELDGASVRSEDGCSYTSATVTTNNGVINSGNEYRNTFKDCENVNIFLNGVELRPPPSPSYRESQAAPYSSDLLDLQDSLRLLYEEEETWFVPFPWMNDKRFERDKYFIHMDIEELDRNSRRTTRQNVGVNSILESLDGTGRVGPRRILLHAEAGFGKSATCAKIAYDWATKLDTSFGRFELVVLVRMRSLAGSLEDHVCRFATRACTRPVPEDDMRKMLSHLRERLLLLLDGLDECSEETLASVLQVVGFDHARPNQSYLRGATIMMTTRPTLVTRMKIYSDRQIRIRLIADDQRDSFVRTYFQADEIPLPVVNILKRIPDVSPLMLFLVCYLHEEGRLSSVEAESEIYSEILTALARRHAAKECLEWTDQDVQIRLAQLGELCFHMIKNRTLFFCQEDVTEHCSCPEGFVFGCGVFRRQLTYDKSKEDSYEPIHKRFVEHLAVLYLNRQCLLESDPERRLGFVKTVVQPPLLRYRKIEVCDFQTENRVCFHCPISEGILDVFVTPNPGAGNDEKDYEVEFLLRSDALARLQNWRDYQSPVCLEIGLILAMQTSSKYGSLKCVPRQYRDVVGHFLDDSGEAVCDFIVHRTCVCSLETTFLKSYVHVKQLVNFEYKERNKDCPLCQSSAPPEWTAMVLRAAKQATSFTIYRRPAQVGDTKKLVSKICLQNNRDERSITTKVKCRAHIHGASTVLNMAFGATRLAAPSSAFYRFDVTGKFLVWILKCFGYPQDFMSCPGKAQSLRIQYSGLEYSFFKDETDRRLYSQVRGKETTTLTLSGIKKLVGEWRREQTSSKESIFRLRFLNNDKMLNLEVAVDPVSPPGIVTLPGEYLVWKVLKT